MHCCTITCTYKMCYQSKRLEIQYQHSIYQQRFQNLKCSVNSTARQYVFLKQTIHICADTRRIRNYISIWHLSFWLQNCQTCIGSTKAANSHCKSATIRLLLISSYWKKGFANPSMLFHIKYCITIYWILILGR